MSAPTSRSASIDDPLRPIVPDLLWTKEQLVRLAGCQFFTRMTVIRLADGLCLHSPVDIDAPTRAAIDALGPVCAIIAPSTVHHLFFASAQKAFPSARTFAIAGLERKRTDLHFDELIGDEPASLWAGQMDQVIIGNRVMREVDFFHRASRTLIAVDLIENFRAETPGTNFMLRALMRMLGMWGRPAPAPELRWMTRDRQTNRAALAHLLTWPFDRAIIAHGELLEQDAQEAIRQAWQWIGRAP
ncbi:MAG: DUF4336 domain-containing protein [Polyangiaceae bacterium]